MNHQRKQKSYGQRITSFLFSGVEKYLLHEQRREARVWTNERLLAESQAAFVTRGSITATRIQVILVELIYRVSCSLRNREEFRHRLFFPTTRFLTLNADRLSQRLVTIFLKDLLDYSPNQDAQDDSHVVIYQTLLKSFDQCPEALLLFPRIVPYQMPNHTNPPKNNANSVGNMVIDIIASQLNDSKRNSSRNYSAALASLIHLFSRNPELQTTHRNALVPLVLQVLERYSIETDDQMVLYQGLSLILILFQSNEEELRPMLLAIFPLLQHAPMAQLLVVRHGIQTNHSKLLCLAIHLAQHKYRPLPHPMVTLEAVVAVFAALSPHRESSATLGPAFLLLDRWATSTASPALRSVSRRILSQSVALRDQVVFVEECPGALPQQPQPIPRRGDSWMEPIVDTRV